MVRPALKIRGVTISRPCNPRVLAPYRYHLMPQSWEVRSVQFNADAGSAKVLPLPGSGCHPDASGRSTGNKEPETEAMRCSP